MSTDDTQSESYDPTTDPDSDPGMLNPREGAQASGAAGDTGGDPDADPANLNPRGGDAATGDVAP